MPEIDDLLATEEPSTPFERDRLGGSMRGELVAGFAVLVLTIAAFFLIAAFVKDSIENSPEEFDDPTEPGAVLMSVHAQGLGIVRWPATLG